MFDDLRRRPEGERRTIAFTLAAVITFIIFLIWLSVLFSRSPSTFDRSVERGSAGNEIETSFSSLKEEFSGFFENVGSQFELQEEPVPEREAVEEPGAFEEPAQEENPY